MKKFFTSIKNIFSIEELRDRIINTVGFLIIFRLGSFVVLPGVNPKMVGEEFKGFMGMLDNFLGGAFSNYSIFGLGIMPYISASIIIQLLTVAMPYFQKMQKEGESGRKKINQITRVLTIAICMVQSTVYISSIDAKAVLLGNQAVFTFTSMVILTAGTIFCMWLGEKITDKGIGNGISMLIMIGIISRFPGSIIAEWMHRGELNGALIFIIEMVALFFVIMAVVALTQAVRKIPIQYAKQVVGNKVYGGQRQYLPMKVNSSGVMPIIFAQSLMFVPGLLAGLFQESEFFQSVGIQYQDYTTLAYNITLGLLIVVFTFFYTAITINPNQIADDLKRNGGFVPGIKPGKPTSEFIDSILTKITLPGSVFLAGVAIFPGIANKLGVEANFAQFYGGTSLLIMVGVVLDTLQQIESYLLMRHYEGLMKSGKIKGRSQAAVA